MTRTSLIAIWIVLCLLFISGCSPSAETIATETSIAATAIATSWTRTPTATFTPSPTKTSIPTSTFTSTPQPTETPQLTNTTSPQVSDRHYEPGGEFSYIPPQGWGLGEFPGLKYKIVYGPPLDNFAPNLNFVDEKFGGTLDKYVSSNLAAIQSLFKDVKVLSQEDFATEEGKRAIKVIVENTQNDTKLRHTFYFFDGGSRKFVVTYTRLPDKQQENDSLVDESVKTFRIEAKATATPAPTTSGSGQSCPSNCSDQTIVRFQFPFEPSFPGYIIEIKSAKFTTDVICAIEQDKKTGEVIGLTDSNVKYGVCNTSSITLYQAIDGDMTVTVILGGFPIVNEVTKGPSSSTDILAGADCKPKCRRTEYDFTSP